MPTDAIAPMEIEAYVDGELDLAHRLAVEEHLAQHPALAAQVMADFRDRTALKLLTESEPALSAPLAATVAKAHGHGMPIWRRPATGIAMMATLGLMTMLGLQLKATMALPPDYVDVAAAFHRSILDRQTNAPAAEVSTHAKAILSASRIAIPRLPADWRVTDAQMLRAKNSPAVLIAVQTTEGHELSLLAIRERSSAPHEPDTVQTGEGQSVAYWRAGDISYALTGEGDPRKIDATADALADSWQA